MDTSQIERLESSFKLLAPRAAELVDRFYANLFARNPAVRPMFPRDMSEQKQKLIASLKLVIGSLRSPDNLRQPLLDMGARHADYGATADHYPIVRDTLVDVMSRMAGEKWNETLDADWKSAIDFVASVMLEGHRAAVSST